MSCDLSSNDRNTEDINDAWGYYGYWVVLVGTLFRKAEREYMNDIVRVLYTIQSAFLAADTVYFRFRAPMFFGVPVWIIPGHEVVSDRGPFCTDRARRVRFLQKGRGPIFLCTYRVSEVNKKFIIWHL